jgi:threonine aldolase
MHEAMFNAPLGDDVFGEDPSINNLQEEAAALFGMEAALFCPSGTMTNQIAVNVHTQPGDEIICHEYSHIYNYEGGGVAFNSGCQMRFVSGNRGRITAAQVESLINNPHDIHAAHTSLVSVENTSNKGGGSCYDFEELKNIAAVCKQHGLQFHIDGARIWNAMVVNNEDPKAYGALFDSISICLSKGLGCPVGSLLLGNKSFIAKALRVRKKFGGGMRQAGMLAAAGSYALQHHVQRLSEDHKKAQVLKNALEACTWVSAIDPVETNIVIFYLHGDRKQQDFLDVLKAHNILLIGMGQGKLRFVTHLDVSMAQIQEVAQVLRSLN